tara:strand:- start:782 stop:1015 length:234 start_codon:yes stop_codon:yes gene_type:complete
MKVGDYIEILRPDFDDGTMILRGIILEVDTDTGLWPVSRVYLFEEQTIEWYYEYEITIISEAIDGRAIQSLLSCAGE